MRCSKAKEQMLETEKASMGESWCRNLLLLGCLLQLATQQFLPHVRQPIGLLGFCADENWEKWSPNIERRLECVSSFRAVRHHVVRFLCFGLNALFLMSNHTANFQHNKQSKSIFSHGLLELGPLCETTNFTSNPSVPTEQQHASASLIVSEFAVLSDSGGTSFPKR